jgi:5-methylcytosine-specific restriction protein A
MPDAPSRPCTSPLCPGLVPEGGACPRCGRGRVAPDARPSARARGYDRGWEKRRLRKLAADPLCEDCLERGDVTPANEVHHMDGDATNGDYANLRSLCKPCHSKRTARAVRQDSR